MIMTSPRRTGALASTMIVMLLAAGAWHGAAGEPAAASAKKPDGPTCDRSAFRLIIDVGHTAEVPGAKTARGLYEYEFNLRLAKLIDQQLRDAGFSKTVLLITEGAKMASLAHRVARANASGADLFLSIHHDSVPDQFLEKWVYQGEEHSFSDRFKGHSLFISNDNADPAGSLTFGRLVGRQLKARGLQYAHHYTEKFMGHRQRILVDAEAGVYRYDQLIVLKDTHMPAVLLEAGSIINRAEELAMATPERQGLISASVLDAVDAFCALRRPLGSTKVAHPATAAPAPAAARTKPAPTPAPAPAASAWPFSLFKRQ
jgi:N-acetylmuramoyl-L-alanine amidase